MMRQSTRNSRCFQGLFTIHAKDSPPDKTRKPAPSLGDRVFSQTLIRLLVVKKGRGMIDILADLQSAKWWVSVFIGSFLMSVVGAYFVRFLDNQLAKTSTWWWNRRKAVDTQYIADLESIGSDPRNERIYSNLETRSRLQAIENLAQFLGVSILLIIFAIMAFPGCVLFPFALLFLFFWFGFVHYSRVARRVERLLADFYSTTSLNESIQRKK